MRRLLPVGLLVVLLGCSSDAAPAAGPTVPEPQPQAPGVLFTEGPASDVVLLRSALFATQELLAGAQPSEFLTGDRLLVVTPETFSEVAATDAGFVDTEISFGGGCPGPCTVPLRSVLTGLLGDLRSGSVVMLETPVTESLRAWPSIGVMAGERAWRLNFGADGTRIVAVEYFGPTPLVVP